jgi:hypothetical protein
VVSDSVGTFSRALEAGGSGKSSSISSTVLVIHFCLSPTLSHSVITSFLYKVEINPEPHLDEALDGKLLAQETIQPTSPLAYTTHGQKSQTHQASQADLPRTSTSSLQMAPQALAINPCYHTVTDSLPRAHTRTMHTQENPARQKILAEIVHGWSAIADGPG